MAHSGGNRFKPDYAIHPGEIIEETLQARGIKQSDFAKWCSLSEKTVSQIINKKAPVSPETAIQFERVLGIAAHIWNNLDSFYNLHLAQQKSRKNLEKTISWAQQFPVKKLADWNFISKPDDKVDAVEQLLNFFGVGSVHAWEEHY
ncbi:MAG: HigA family addiction module antitoxin, partial [Thermodesulfobacteriota bacterium]